MPTLANRYSLEFHILIETLLYVAWFAAWFNLTGGEGQGSGPDPEALRRRLQGNGSEDPDGRDGSDSNCSDNMLATTGGGGGGGGSSGGAFRPTTSTGAHTFWFGERSLRIYLSIPQQFINISRSCSCIYPQVPQFRLRHTYCLTCIPRDCIHHLRYRCFTIIRLLLRQRLD